MNRPLTSGQAQVLRRLADNPDAPPPLDGWKASAVAMQTRGLVTIARKGGQYLVTPTGAARYYREHDSYPPKLPVGATTSPVGEQAGSAKRHRGQRRPAAGAPPVEASPPETSVEPLPDLASLLGKPHPAVRSLWKHPAALPKDERSRVDAILAANALVLAAKEAGFRIEGHVQPRKRSHTYGVYTGEPFVTLDAGDCPVLVRVGELVKRAPHVLTDEEKLRKKLNQYVYAPAYDYEPSGLACFRAYPGQSYRGGTRYLETKTKKLESFVPRIIAEVEGASEAARARADLLGVASERHRVSHRVVGDIPQQLVEAAVLHWHVRGLQSLSAQSNDAGG